MTRERTEDFRRLVSFLGDMLGPDYEVAFFTLPEGRPRVEAIVNGRLSGMDVGAAPTGADLRLFSEWEPDGDDRLMNYRAASANGRVLRCSAMYLRDGSGRVEGALRISFDDSRYRELSERVFGLCHPDEYAFRNISISQTSAQGEPERRERAKLPLDAEIDAALRTATGSPHTERFRLTQGEKRETVRLLNEGGAFRLKGAVAHVAERIGCSPASVYRYLSAAGKGGEAEK